MHVGKNLILSTKPFAKEIRWKSWYYTLSTLLLLTASMCGTFFLPFVWAKLACSVLSGLLMMRFFVIYHDYQHHTILHKSIPARILFSLYGIYMLSPVSIWKRSHDYHHNHNSKLFTASIGSYPIMTLEKYMQASKSERIGYLASRHPLNILFGYFTMFVYGMCIQSFRSSPRRHWDSLAALVIHGAAAVFLVVFFGWAAWFMTLFLPFFISLMIGAYLFYAQHNFPGVSFNPREKWSYLEAALSSSSYLQMNPLLRWFSANIGYHHIHHLNSRIPFYRLPEVMSKLPSLQQPHVTTFKPSDVMACLRLKVWDSESRRMLTARDLRSLGLDVPI